MLGLYHNTRKKHFKLVLIYFWRKKIIFITLQTSNVMLFFVSDGNYDMPSLHLQVNLNDFYWVKAITHVQSPLPEFYHVRQNIRTYVGEYPRDPTNSLFPSQVCHQTEHMVEVPKKTRYDCIKVLFGKFIYIDQYGKPTFLHHIPDHFNLTSVMHKWKLNKKGERRNHHPSSIYSLNSWC